MDVSEHMTKYNQNREYIINKALDLFGARGFRGTSIRDIARAADMSISNIYHYFGNKEGLMLAVMEYSTHKMLSNLREVSKLDIHPLDRFRLLVKANVYNTIEHMKRAKIIDINEEHLSPAGTEARRLIQREILDIYLKELSILEELGYVEVRSLTVLAFNILGMVNWLIRWYRLDGRLNIEEVAEEIVSLCLHGMLKPTVHDRAEV